MCSPVQFKSQALPFTPEGLLESVLPTNGGQSVGRALAKRAKHCHTRFGWFLCNKTTDKSMGFSYQY
jgi:hypothetical protein